MRIRKKKIKTRLDSARVSSAARGLDWWLRRRLSFSLALTLAYILARVILRWQQSYSCYICHLTRCRIYTVWEREKEREREKGESARATESLGQVNARHGVAQQAAFRLNNALTAAWLQSNTQRGLARANREKESRSICACWTIRQHPRISINAGYRRTPAVIHRTAHSLYLPLCPFRPPSRLSFARAASSLL